MALGLLLLKPILTVHKCSSENEASGSLSESIFVDGSMWGFMVDFFSYVKGKAAVVPLALLKGLQHWINQMCFF